ncbi:phage baseplate assembly protein [Falsiroseomonas sp.]|uniref:phage baseplate assembly protein n=1 Tax=Falsiroseomonas sp. TaxID=2870721 RepID=UPI003F714DBA
MTTRRIALVVDGQTLDLWTDVEVTRDLGDIAGGFLVELYDAARIRAAIAGPAATDIGRRVDPGAQVEIRIDGEAVLRGYIDEIKLTVRPEEMRVAIAGRDATGDLVDGAASVDGPFEFRGLTLTEIVSRICAPFGIAVRAEAPVGEAFPIFSLDAAERAMEAIERACRQRAVLALSDGVGGLVLTQAGKSRAPERLSLPGNIHAAVVNRSWAGRHDQYVVKGQSRPQRTGGPALDSTLPPVEPGAPPPLPRPPQRQERATIVMTGRARDAEITRHRPRVVLAKSQSGGASVQTQAEWMLRVARGKADKLTYTMLDWRAGPDRRLWRPNELALLDDPFAGILGEMLVCAVAYRYSEREGSTTLLTLCGPEALDMEPEGDRRAARRRRRTTARRLDSSLPDVPAPPA